MVVVFLVYFRAREVPEGRGRPHFLVVGGIFEGSYFSWVALVWEQISSVDLHSRCCLCRHHRIVSEKWRSSEEKTFVISACGIGGVGGTFELSTRIYREE